MKVYPMSKNALNIAHPEAGKLRVEGSVWPDDGFTFRMVADGEVTEDQTKAWTPSASREDDTEE